MEKLNLPEYSFRIATVDSKTQIFDGIRKKYVTLTDEEWVRQNFIMYLISEKKYPASLISIEKSLQVNRMEKRADIVVYGKDLKPKVIVECKAPSVAISQEVFDQVARYNIPLKVDYLIVTNGLIHYCCKIDFNNNEYTFINEVPDFLQI